MTTHADSDIDAYAVPAASTAVNGPPGLSPDLRMGRFTTASPEERGALRGAVKSIRREWRENLALARKLNPDSKLARKVDEFRCDLDILDDLIAEMADDGGVFRGEDRLAFLICAEVASGRTLEEWCTERAVNCGLAYAFLTETTERSAQYDRALRGHADRYVAQVVGIADGADPESVAVSKLQVDTRMKVAAKYDRTRFGEDRQVGGVIAPTFVINFTGEAQGVVLTADPASAAPAAATA